MKFETTRGCTGVVATACASSSERVWSDYSTNFVYYLRATEE